jgi:hypothetical protein
VGGEKTVTDQPEITARKLTGYVPVPIEMAMDCGMMTEAEARARGWTPTSAPKISRWRQLRWRWYCWRERLGRRVGGAIAGIDLSERDE